MTLRISLSKISESFYHERRGHKNDYLFLVIGCPISSSFNSSLVTFDSRKALEARLMPDLMVAVKNVGSGKS